MSDKFLVITTIQKDPPAVKKFSEFLKTWNLIIVGDEKTPHMKSKGNITFLSISDQQKLNYYITKGFPYNHYARKNIGYLYCIKNKASIIYETDDDNFPKQHWGIDSFSSNKMLTTPTKFINICNYFTNKFIWCRGFPLDEIRKKQPIFIKHRKNNIGILQTLIDKDPDVDACFRLIIGHNNIHFKKNLKLSINKGTYSPFNSQSTFWRKECFYLMYLPVLVNFRFTDILRSYITQKLMWEDDFYLAYCSPIVYQERNKHDLMKDFIDEINMYIHIKNIVNIIDTLKFEGTSKFDDLLNIYTILNDNNYIKREELKFLKSWLKDIEKSIS